MGWCHEFGSQIRHGCDHPMVANVDACSCPGCGVRCNGKFASCDLVWERGPWQVTLVRPVHDQRAVRPNDDGPLALNPVRPSALAPASAPTKSTPGPADDATWLVTTLEGLRSDLRALREAVESRHAAGPAGTGPPDLPPDRLVVLVEGLPERIGVAVSRAIGRRLKDTAPVRPSPPLPSSAPSVARAPSGPVAQPPPPSGTPARPRGDAEPVVRPATSAPAAAGATAPHREDDDHVSGTPVPAAASSRPVPEVQPEERADARDAPDDTPLPTPSRASAGLPGWESLRARLSTWASKPTGTG